MKDTKEAAREIAKPVEKAVRENSETIDPMENTQYTRSTENVHFRRAHFQSTVMGNRSAAEEAMGDDWIRQLAAPSCGSSNLSNSPENHQIIKYYVGYLCNECFKWNGYLQVIPTCSDGEDFPDWIRNLPISKKCGKVTICATSLKRIMQCRDNLDIDVEEASMQAVTFSMYLDCQTEKDI